MSDRAFGCGPVTRGNGWIGPRAPAYRATVAAAQWFNEAAGTPRKIRSLSHLTFAEGLAYLTDDLHSTEEEGGGHLEWRSLP